MKTEINMDPAEDEDGVVKGTDIAACWLVSALTVAGLLVIAFGAVAGFAKLF